MLGRKILARIIQARKRASEGIEGRDWHREKLC